MRSIYKVFIILSLFCFNSNLKAQTSSSETPVTFDQVKLKHKIVPLSNSVYRILDHYESSGELGFLPQARPYTKITVLKFLEALANSERLTQKEKATVNNYISDLTRESQGIQFYKQSTDVGFAVLGLGGKTSFQTAAGENATWATSNIFNPYLSGDLGEHLTFHASMGLAIERLAPDLFYQSYTKDGQVNFPYQSVGTAFQPYQFGYETMWAHVPASGETGEGPPVRKELTSGMIYHTELSSSFYEGALQVSIHNQQRSWGNDGHNLMLSSTARRFPGIEMKIQPTSWVRYSYMTGSLFSYDSQKADYKLPIYGYDLGQVQKNLTLHMLEFTPAKWLQVTASGGNLWSKRLELAYMVPFVLPHFTQIDVGDHDNLTMSLDVATQFRGIGKTWFSFFVDEFSFTKSGSLLKMPRNRYAWQLGWKTSLLSALIPGTSSTLKYTRLTPFVYTHYPETGFNTFDTNRPLDMTYTHDQANLGFYLPPNSGELNWSLVNIAIPDLVLSLDNRLIIHGTNDLASENVYQIYGDVYRDQLGADIYQYPLLNFTKDGIYDWTVVSDFKFDWRVRKPGIKSLHYFRITGGLGVSRTWWESNNSGVVAPAARTLVTGSLGMVVDI